MDKPVNVCVLVGSLRKASFNGILANALISLAPSSMKVNIVEVGQLPLYNEDLETVPPPAPWTAFRQRVKAADAVLFVTPEYNRSVPAVLKNALDVGSRPYGSSVWDRKPGAIVSGSPGAIGAFGANHHLRQSLVFLNVPTMQQPEAYLGRVDKLFDEHGKLVGDGTRKFLQGFMLAFANWVETIRSQGQRIRRLAESAGERGVPLSCIEYPNDFFEPEERRHGSSNISAGKGCGGRLGNQGVEASPRSEQRLLSARRHSDPRRDRTRQEGAGLHGEQGQADHQQVLVRRCVSLRAAAVLQGAANRWPGLQGYGCAGGSQKLFGFVAMELSRVDASFCTFWGVHSGLAMGSIYLDGSEEQKRQWLPAMARYEKIGCFGLTEPLVGSGTSRGMLTTAKRDGDTWVLNGQKRWIGNATWCDVSIIWARDVADNQVKGFIVENKTTPGFSVEKIEHKIALKVVQNGQITLKDVRLPEANRLQGGNSFRDTARVLRMTRYMVGWASTGVQMGAFEATLKYTQERLQFGKPIASFQMVQDLLAKMLANVTACQCLMVRLAQMDDAGKLGDQHAALAKAFCTAKSRETVAWGRELLGGNGIVADYNVARFFTDAEALYSYEGTYQMQNLIVGKAITGFGAFV